MTYFLPWKLDLGSLFPDLAVRANTPPVGFGLDDVFFVDHGSPDRVFVTREMADRHGEALREHVRVRICSYLPGTVRTKDGEFELIGIVPNHRELICLLGRRVGECSSDSTSSTSRSSPAAPSSSTPGSPP